MNELTPSGTQLTTSVSAPTTEFQLVASTAEQMQAAQSQLSQWFSCKVAACELEANDAAENLRIAEREGFKLPSFQRANRLAWRRVDFYKKCQAAVDAGYALVPNFPVDVFAVRTNKRRPKEDESAYSKDRTQHSEGPPIGVGEYVADQPTMGEYKRNRKLSDGRIVDETVWYSDQFDPEIEYPVSVANPKVMAATAEAMAMGVFDEIGALPERRRKGDPIVVGIVRLPMSKYQVKEVSFLISWYIDTKTL